MQTQFGLWLWLRDAFEKLFVISIKKCILSGKKFADVYKARFVLFTD